MSETTTQQPSEQTGGCGCGGCGCGGGQAQSEGLQIVAAPVPATGAEPGDLDVRGLPREERHAKIFAAFGALAPGEAFILTNDHDPLPLRAKLEAQHLGSLGWEYLVAGPDIWRIQISMESCC